MSFFVLLLIVNAAVITAAFFYCLHTDKTDYVDAAWALCISLAALIFFLMHEKNIVFVWVSAVTFCWYLRLASFLFNRARRDDEEDSRYQAMKAYFKEKAPSHNGYLRYYALFFVMQFLVAALFSAHLLMFATLDSQAIANAPATVVSSLIVLASIVVALAFFGQTTADNQLQAFKKKQIKQDGQAGPAVMQEGLWKYSRHPNYFFECVHWMAYPIIGSYFGLYGLWVMPLLMYFFVVYLTGVPFSEKQALAKRGEAYAQYQKTTPRIFPINLFK